MTSNQLILSILPILRTIFAIICFGSAATAAHSLTIGNIRGAVLIGKSVNVTLPVQLDTGEVASSVCAEAELYYADNRVDNSRVLTRWDAPDAKGEAVLRIQSTVGVDEPMVSITIRVGCNRKTERRYVLLADLPIDSINSYAVVLPSVLSTSSIPIKKTARAVEAAVKSTVTSPSLLVGNASVAKVPPKVPSSTSLKAAVKKVVPVAVPAAASSVPTGKPVASAVRLSIESAQPKPRLTLESLPAANVVNAGLKSSWELITVPADNDQARTEAKALWRSLNPQAEDAQRALALETQVKTLQITTAKNQTVQNALKEQLLKAEEERYTNGVVGVLAALLVCALAGATYLWLRMRRLGSSAGKDWWRSESVESSILSDLAPVSTVARTSIRGNASVGGKQNRSLDVDLGVDESMFDSLKPKSSTVVRKASRPTQPPPDSILSSPRSGFFNSSMGSRAVNVEELFDIQQQAEFFVSLGQHDQAIELLRQHIYGVTSTSGLAYLDLLQLYHKFNRRQEYDQLRDEFNHSFNAKVPPFEQFNQQNRGIERYPSAMSRIESAWKTPSIAQVLHDCIFRKPDLDDSEAFDLEAYRELLLLFSIANAVAEDGAGVTASGFHSLRANLDPLPDFGRVPSQFASSNVPTPLASDKAKLVKPSAFLGVPSAMVADADADAAATPAPLASVPPGAQQLNVDLPMPSKNLGLDVDLFELESVMSLHTMTTLPELLQPVHELSSLNFSISLPAAMTPLASSAVPPPETLEEPSLDLDLHNFFAEENTQKKPNLP